MKFIINKNVIGKSCSNCRKTKTIFDFYKHPEMTDGYLNKCKECVKVDVRLNYQRKIIDVDWRLKERERSRQKFHRLYSNDRPIKTASYNKKKKARYLTDNAVRDKRLTKPDICTFSFEETCFGRIEAHHINYDKPLEVVWLCTSHHRYIHRKVF